jgi:hypothetical protein
MLAVRDPPVLVALFAPLQPAKPAAAHANTSRPTVAYPTRLVIGMRRCNDRNAIKITDRIPSGKAGSRGGVRGSLNGTNCERAVVNVALQNAAPELDAVAAVGVHVAAEPKLLVPFLNCTVPVGPAPLLEVEIVAVSVTLPPATTLVGLLATAPVVAALVIVTLSAAEVLAL